MRERHIIVWVQRLKDRDNLALQWTDPETGRRRSKNSGTSDLNLAKKLRADLEYELNHGMHNEASGIDWETFREMFHREVSAGIRPRAAEKHETVLDVFEQIVKPRKLRDINERAISRFVQGMRVRKKRGGAIGLATITVRNYLVVLKTALGWAAEQRLIPKMPSFPRIKVPKKKPQAIPSESFEKLLEKAPGPFWKAYLLCAWWAGLRLSEARYLHRDPSERFPWIDFEQNRIVLPAAFAKSDEDQWVPLHPVLREALFELPRIHGSKFFDFRSKWKNRPLSRPSITHKILDFALKAGVKLSMHKLRKGFGCRVAQQLGKGNAPILHTLMRHSSMQVTMEYYATCDPVLHEAIESLT